MHACKGQRLLDQPLPLIGKWLALGLAIADDMAQLADRVEAAVKDRGTG